MRTVPGTESTFFEAILKFLVGDVTVMKFKVCTKFTILKYECVCV
jgi:hypothetical protein